MTPAADSFVRGPVSLVSNGVVVLFVAVVLLSVVVLLHHVLSERRRHLDRLRFESAALALAPSLLTADRTLEREIAATRLRSGDRAVALVLRKTRNDVRGEVAERAAAILTDMGEVSRLLHEARSRRAWRRLAAVRALGECGGARARKALMQFAANDRSDEVCSAAREGLLQDGTDEAVRFAVDSFLKAPPERGGARYAFFLRLAAASEEQMRTLMDSGLSVADQKLALEAVGNVGRRSAMTLAKQHLMSRHPELRATAIRAVGKIGGEGEMRLAIHSLDDEEWFVRAAAARALESLLGLRSAVADTPMRESARDRLQKHLADPSWWVRANSARALARAGQQGLELLRLSAGNLDDPAHDAARAVLAMAGVNLSTASIAVLDTPEDFDPDLTLRERPTRQGGISA